MQCDEFFFVFVFSIFLVSCRSPGQLSHRFQNFEKEHKFFVLYFHARNENNNKKSDEFLNILDPASRAGFDRDWPSPRKKASLLYFITFSSFRVPRENE